MLIELALSMLGPDISHRSFSFGSVFVTVVFRGSLTSVYALQPKLKINSAIEAMLRAI